MPAIEATVQPYAGKPALHLNGAPQLPAMYALTDCPGGRYTWEELPQRQIRQFAQAGLKLFQFDLWLSEHVYLDDGPMDLEICRKQVRGITEVCPDAAIMIRLHVNSSEAWNEEHPDECVRYADAGYKKDKPEGFTRPLVDDEHNVRRFSFASKLWCKSAEGKLREFLLALAACPEGDAIMGIQIAGGVFGEWHHWGLVSHEPDVSQTMLDYFRNWLEFEYGTSQKLSEAWGRNVDFATASFPTMGERFATSDGIFRDPKVERPCIDYYRALQNSTVDAILPLCETVKQVWPRPILVGSFYGYFKFLFGRHTTGGHLEVKRYLESPYVDFLASPQTYPDFCRHLGGTGESRGLLDACRRAGKLCLDEMDQVTHLGSIQIPVVTKNFDEDQAIIRRNVLQPFSYGMGHWYYDFGPFHQAGAWDRPRFMQVITELNDFMKERFTRELNRPADTLLVYDPQSLYHVGNRVHVDPISTLLIDDFYAGLLRSGVIFEDAWLFELQEMDLSSYRTIIFANTFLLSPAEREMIQSKVCCEGRHVIWNYLPGYSDGERLSLDHVEDLTGFSLGLKTWQEPGCHRIVEGSAMGRRQPFVPESGGMAMDDPLQEPFPAVCTPTYRPTPYPVFKCEVGVQVFARDANSGEATVARRLGLDHCAWLCAAPLRDPIFINALLTKTDSHLIQDQGDVCYAGHDCLIVHTGTGGPRELRLPNGKSIVTMLPKNHTRVFDLESGDVLLD